MATPDQPRRQWIVGAVKIEHEQRDVAHAVITPADDRGFFNVIGADDHDDAGHTLPVGSDVAYRVELTDAEAETFRRASNCRYVELDSESTPHATAIPSPSSLRFMDADFSGAAAFDGRDVLVGLVDGGTTAAVRSYIGATMVDRKVFSSDDPGADEITSEHGCLVAPCLIPQGGRFLDAIAARNNGSAANSALAAAARWCADQGAKIINHSYGGGSDSVWNDLCQYLLDRNVQYFCSMGNDNKNVAAYPAALSTTFSNVHSSISFDEVTGKRSTFSNYTSTASGCAPGTNVLGLSPAGAVVIWNGTSASSPHMARLCTMGATAARFTAAQMGAALKAHTRNTGQPAAEQGAGAYDLKAALVSLNALATVNAGADIQVTPGATFTRTATEADFATGSIASRAWTIVAVPAGAPAVASLVGTTIGTAAALSWTTPVTPGGYRLRYAAKNSGGVTLAFDEVAVTVATNPAVPSTGPIVIDPDPIPAGEAFGVPTLVVETRTLPEVPTFPGFVTFPGPNTFPRGSLDPRFMRKRTGWTTYPGPATYPGPGTWPGWGHAGAAPPPFDVEWFLLDDSGNYRCSLPDVKAATITDVANAALSVSVDYPVDGLNFTQLREHVDAGVDATVAIRFAGTAEWELQAILSECDGDDVADAAVWQFRGGGSLLDEAVVYPDPGTADGKVAFDDASPGAIVTELVGRAQARGGLDIDTSTFSEESDSHGQPWPADLISSPSFAAGDSSTYLRVLQLLADAGLCEFEMRGRSLRIYQPSGRGFDRTVGTPVVFQAGRDLLEASRRHNVRPAVTSLLVLGADGDWVEVADDTALGRRRRRVEGAASQGSLSGGALRAYGRAKLATAAAAQAERVHKLVIVDDSPLPVRDFGVGDLVWSDSDGNRRRLRVAQWTLTLDDQGLSGSVSLGDLIDDPLLRLTRKLLGIGDGSSVTGTAGGPKTVEGLTPAAPGGLTVQSVTSPRADGASDSTLLATWDPVVLAADGTSGVDVTGYRLRWRYTATTAAGVPLAGEWTVIDEIDGTTAQVEGLIPAAQVEVQVGAYSVVTTTVPEPETVPDPTPDPTTPGTPSGPVPTTVAEALRLGTGTGKTPVNLGVDFLPGEGPAGFQGKHKDYTLAEITAGLDSSVLPKYVEMRPDGAVRLTAHVGGATTPHSTHSRTEFRELAADGKAHAEWSSKSGRHFVYAVGKIIKLPAGRQRVCIAQVHTPDDDLCMVLVDQGVNVESTYGDTGRPGRLTSNLQLGAVCQWGIELVREGSQTVIKFYWNDDYITVKPVPKATQVYSGGDGLYFKAGCYQQSSTATDSVGETCIIDLYDLEMQHDGGPGSGTRRPYQIGWTGAGAGPNTGGTTGGGGGGQTQTLGVGGVAKPAGAITGQGGAGAWTITTGGTVGSPRVLDGEGRTVGTPTIKAPYVVFQNYKIQATGQYGAVIDADNVTFQNNEIKGVHASGDGDLNAITFFGNGTRILFNDAENFVSGSPGSSHTDACQTWVSSSHPTASSNVEIRGNTFVGPANPSRSNSIASIHQCVMAEDFQVPGSGNTGGSSSGMKNWKIIGNTFGDSWNQCIKLDGVDDVVISKNIFAGDSDKVVDLGSGANGVKFYSDNVTTSGNYGSIGISITPGSGPA